MVNNNLPSYSEAVDLIYSVPTFSFRHQNVETFFAFVCAIPKHRWDKIRYLDLCWINQRKAHGDVQPPEHYMDMRWSYKRISNIKALSDLPEPSLNESENPFVYPECVINEILKKMGGLKKGGVKWGSKSTGCFAQG
jgi:hypothetical protein